MTLSSRLPPFVMPLPWLDAHDPMSIGSDGIGRSVGAINSELSPLKSSIASSRRVSASYSAGAVWDRKGVTAPLYEPWRLPITGITYRHMSAADFDFSTALVYWRRPIKKENVVFAEAAELVRTIIDGKEETKKMAQVGDAIVTGPLGERYVPPNFWGIYEEDPDDPTQYRAKPGVTIRAIELSVPAALMPPWRELQRLEFSYIAQSSLDPNDVRLIDKRAFELTWYVKPQD